MASGKSDYLEAALLNQLFGNVAYSIPSPYYFALFTSAPNDTGGGTEVNTSGTGYTRVSVTNNTTNFPTISPPTAKSNGTAVNFPISTAAWGSVVAFGIYDAASAGNLLFWGDLTTARSVLTGDTPRFAAGALVITED
jgi:hypothetical protein